MARGQCRRVRTFALLTTRLPSSESESESSPARYLSSRGGTESRHASAGTGRHCPARRRHSLEAHARTGNPPGHTSALQRRCREPASGAAAARTLMALSSAPLPSWTRNRTPTAPPPRSPRCHHPPRIETPEKTKLSAELLHRIQGRTKSIFNHTIFNDCSPEQPPCWERVSQLLAGGQPANRRTCHLRVGVSPWKACFPVSSVKDSFIENHAHHTTTDLLAQVWLCFRFRLASLASLRFMSFRIARTFIRDRVGTQSTEA